MKNANLTNRINEINYINQINVINFESRKKEIEQNSKIEKIRFYFVLFVTSISLGIFLSIIY